jgi:RNA polymerase sigma-70 factor (ECF subfamily)
MFHAAEIFSAPSVNKTVQPMAMNFVPILDRPITQTQQQSSDSREDDFALLKRYAGLGDPQAFAQIVQRYASFVYATCLRVIGDGSRAEDLSQETFFRLMRRPHEVRQNLGGWLHRTATHLALDSLRSETARKRREIVYTRECDHEASTWAELSPAVDQALADMPEELRNLLVQHFLLGKSQAELATDTGQSPSTISRRMHAALDELRQHLRLKGVYALPAALAGLLCHVAARQAPATLVHELGKMSMISGVSSAARAAQFGSADPFRHPPSPKIFSRLFSPPMALAVLGMIGALALLQFLGFLWGSGATRPIQPEEQQHLKPKPAIALVIWGPDGPGAATLQKAP